MNLITILSTYIKYIFHVKIQLFVAANSDRDPDPDCDLHGSYENAEPAFELGL